MHQKFKRTLKGGMEEFWHSHKQLPSSCPPQMIRLNSNFMGCPVCTVYSLQNIHAYALRYVSCTCAVIYKPVCVIVHICMFMLQINNPYANHKAANVSQTQNEAVYRISNERVLSHSAGACVSVCLLCEPAVNRLWCQP